MSPLLLEPYIRDIQEVFLLVLLYISYYTVPHSPPMHLRACATVPFLNAEESLAYSLCGVSLAIS